MKNSSAFLLAEEIFLSTVAVTASLSEFSCSSEMIEVGLSDLQFSRFEKFDEFVELFCAFPLTILPELECGQGTARSPRMHGRSPLHTVWDCVGSRTKSDEALNHGISANSGDWNNSNGRRN